MRADSAFHAKTVTAAPRSPRGPWFRWLRQVPASPALVKEELEKLTPAWDPL